MSTKQQTLKAPISFSGKGLHTGVKVTMTVNPADADTGIVFRRTDIEGQPIIPALCDNVVDTSRGTTIESGGHRVSTIEHIMSALWTLGVDNAVIDIDAPETPIMDGSACAYAKAITEIGRRRPGRRAQVLPRDRKDGLHDPREGRGDHPLPRRRILRLGARGLQLEGHRQPVRHLQPRRQLRRQNRARAARSSSCTSWSR